MVSREIRKARGEILMDFPGLDRDKLEITSPKSDQYNCFSYVVGDLERIWSPDPLIGYWPPDVPRRMTIKAVQNVFESLGYEETENSNLEKGIEKVAIFEKNGKPCHAARQLPDGLWTSKLGRGYDISHDLEGLQGEEYGAVYLVMEKTCKK